MIEGTQLGKAE